MCPWTKSLLQNLPAMLGGLCVALFLAACGSGSPSDVQSLPVREPVMRLPPVMFHSATDYVRSDCDVQVRVEFHTVGTRLKGLLLSDHVDGVCEVMTLPKRRYYALELMQQQCGSRIYSGELQTDDAVSVLVITDHSGRTCPGLRPAMFELEETDESGITRKFYGNWDSGSE